MTDTDLSYPHFSCVLRVVIVLSLPDHVPGGTIRVLPPQKYALLHLDV